MVAHAPGAIADDVADDLVAEMRAGLQANAFELAFSRSWRWRAASRRSSRRCCACATPTAPCTVPVPWYPRRTGRADARDRPLGAAARHRLLATRRDESRPLRLFVSQSPRTLADDAHAEWLVEALANHRLAGASLVIDLRMDDALVHSETLRRFCDLLAPAGVEFCLSQYVAGPEAEALLQQLRLRYLRSRRAISSAHTEPALRDGLRGGD